MKKKISSIRYNPQPAIRQVCEMLEQTIVDVQKRIDGGDPVIINSSGMDHWRGHLDGELANAKHVLAKFWEIIADMKGEWE